MNKEKLTKAENWWKELTGESHKKMGINEKDLIGMYESIVDKENMP